MAASIWDANVELKIDERFHVIRNAREAVAFLIKSWPEPKSESYATARKICLDAANGVASSAEARAVFEAAAKEAGLLQR
ncbi:DUF982 domain-containing protein [Sinorhizobium sp. GL28]|uniref:DUF982 domain-containing protein n=1 Tax=Sinorhizobium sp. GL28 TaxID=1358418 RepID=UPI00071E01D3|nr:DUF982 domain-containing protein [Sinorhizobium sp. GL28]KSV91575.1 hypothetical protein N184_24995 [Sinorhizobium sp. GL28]